MSRDTPLPPLTDAEIEMLLHEYGSRWPYEAAAIARLCRDLKATREALNEIIARAKNVQANAPVLLNQPERGALIIGWSSAASIADRALGEPKPRPGSILAAF